MDRIRVGIVGAGNCASALVQGVEYYRNAGDSSDIPGLMHARLGGYHVSDIEFSCAFDVDAEKVGLDLSKALVSGHNNTIHFADVPETGVIVSRGPTLDGLGRYYRQEIVESPAPPVDVAKVLAETRTQVLINYLPVGSERAAKFYAEAALEAGVGFVNCMPVFISSHPAWASRFAERGIPLIGDDVKSQVGSTIIHRVLAKLFEDRGV
ncbi:MAG TPA: inositol-3-phosphate synthase, partial [Actinomycetota bacterium]|nr:inositol-3-phosphate synthase [Actinomycetota bacterium]